MEIAVERRIAKMVGGKRIPVTGERHGVDVDAGAIKYQVKHRAKMPQYMKDWLGGIEETARRHTYHGIPCSGVVIWGEPNKRDRDAAVVLSLKEWLALVGKGPY